MKTWMKALLIALPVAMISVPVGQILWPAPTGGEAEMSGLMIMGFVGVSVFEGLGLGLGVAFVLLGLPLVRKLAAATGSGTLAWLSFASIVWFLISWWPHDGLHRSMGHDMPMATLLAVEYGFHVTLILAGAVLAYAFVRAATRLLAQGEPATTAPYSEVVATAGSEA